MKKEAFVELLVKAQIDPQVKSDQELLGIINAALQDLKKDEPVNLVASKTSRSLSFYLASHYLTAPQTVLDVLKVANKEDNKYRGEANTAFIFGNLFGGR